MKTKVMTTAPSLQFVYTNIDVIDNKATGIYKDQSPAQTPSPPITPLSTSPTSPQIFNGPTIISTASELTPTISSNMTITNNNINNNNHNNNNSFGVLSNEYHREDVRLQTFTNNWPHPYLNVTKLATIGFYYIGPYDTVKCNFCKVEIGRWEPEDNELTEHIRWSQNCPLLKRRETSNIPLDENELDRILPPISYDVCGPCGIGGGIVDIRPGAYAESSFTPSNTSDPPSPTFTSTSSGRLMARTTTAPPTSTASSLLLSAIAQPPPPSSSTSSLANNLLQPVGSQQRAQLPPPLLLLPPPPPSPGQQFAPRFPFEPFQFDQSTSSLRLPVHSEYAIEADRLRSFDDWPKTMKQKPKELSDAGFFYTRTGDRVKCFSCAGGLRDWDEGDIPWEQHAIWFDQCEYLKLMKGQDYIDEVQRKYRALEEASANSNANSNQSESEQQQQLAMATGGENNRTIQLQTQSNTSTNNSNNNNNNNSNSSSNNNNNNERFDTLTAVSPSVSASASSLLAQAIPNRSGTYPSMGSSQLEEQQKPPQQLSNNSGGGSSSSSNRDERLCRICFVNEYNTIFHPCGHVVACAKCASSVSKCPMCRKPFDRIMKVFFP